MKVIKRDGRAVDYDRNKIVTAIEKANKEVNSSNQATKEDIKGIITYIEELGKKRMLVEVWISKKIYCVQVYKSIG